MNSDPLSRLAHLAMPGHGFVGSTALASLKVPVGASVDCMRIVVEGRSATNIDLADLTIALVDGKSGNAPDLIGDVRLSSVHTSVPASEVLPRFRDHRELRSDWERQPSVTLFLTKAVDVDSVELRNRTGRFMPDSMRFVIDTWVGAEKTSHYRHVADDGLVECFSGLAARAGGYEEHHMENRYDARLEAVRLRERIGQKVRSGELTLTSKEALWLLPMYDGIRAINEDSIVFLAELMAIHLCEKVRMPTHALKDFQHLVSSPHRIGILERLVLDSMERRGGEPDRVVFAKHNIGPSEINDKVEEIGPVLMKVQEQLRAWGAESMICYGTLLGAVRNNAVIPHDDDVDMLYVDESKSREEMISNKEAMIRKFEEAGYWVGQVPSENYHVRPPGSKLHVDLFPCWREDGSCWTMMERGQYRKVPIESLLPVGEREFYGTSVSVPADSRAFLENRYGSDWTESKPYHEWPIRIDDPLEWEPRASVTHPTQKRTMMIAWDQQVVRGINPPRNSLPIVELALEKGYDAVEIHVRQAGDGVFVLAHDEVLVDEKGRRINVSKSTSAELASFNIGTFEGRPTGVARLEEALSLLRGSVLLLGARVSPAEIPALRSAIDEAGFDAGRIVFCGHDDNFVRALNISFPESVVLYKFSETHHTIDDLVLDDLVAKQIDGLMLHWPLDSDDSIDPFMQKVKRRRLKVLFFVHPIGPTSHAAVYSAAKGLKRMAAAGVDFVTTIDGESAAFQEITASSDLWVGLAPGVASHA